MRDEFGLSLDRLVVSGVSAVLLLGAAMSFGLAASPQAGKVRPEAKTVQAQAEPIVDASDYGLF